MAYHTVDAAETGTAAPDSDPAAPSAPAVAAASTAGGQAGHRHRPVEYDELLVHYRRADGDYLPWSLHVWGDVEDSARLAWPAGHPFTGEDSFGRSVCIPLAPGARHVGFVVVGPDGAKDVSADRSADTRRFGEIWLKQDDGTVYASRLDADRVVLHPYVPDTEPQTDLTRARAHWIDRDTVLWRRAPSTDHTYALVSAGDGSLAVARGRLRGAGNEIRLRPAGDQSPERRSDAWRHLWEYTAFSVDPADRERIGDALRGQVIVVERDAGGTVRAATAVQLPGVLDDVYAAATAARLGPVVHDGQVTLAVWAPTARHVELLVDEGSTVAMTRDDGTGVWSATGPWLGAGYRYRVTAWQPATHRVETATVTDPYSVAVSADGHRSLAVDLADPALAPAGWAEIRKPGIPQHSIHAYELSVRDFSIADHTVPPEYRGTYRAFTVADSAGVRHLRGLARAGLSHVQLLPIFDFATVPERRADQWQPPCDLAGMAADSEQQQACVAAVADVDGFNWGYDPLHFTSPEGSYATDPDGTARITELREMVAALHAAGLRVVMDVVYNHTVAAGVHPHSVLDQVVPGYYHRLLDDGTIANSTCCSNTATEHAMMGKLVVDSVRTWASAYKIDGFRFDLMGHHPRQNILDVRAALDALTLDEHGVDGAAVAIWGEGWNFGEVAFDSRFAQASQGNLAGTGIGTFNDRLRDAVRGGVAFETNPRGQGFGTGLYTDPNGDPVNGHPDHQRGLLLHLQDVIQVGLTGNLASYRFTESSGRSVTGAELYRNGSPVGYTASPAESVTYVDAHDNEILYDALAYKLPQWTSAADRARAQVVALATTVLAQGVGMVAAGSDRLRSKSLDRNSYNSGDWFNAIRWDGEHGNGFGRGLPPAVDNVHTWAWAKPLLGDPALVPDRAAIDAAAAGYADLLRIRRSSRLFHLGSAEEVQLRLSFPLSGPGATPGVITMLLDDTAGERLDVEYSAIAVVFNAAPQTVAQTVPALAGGVISLHPVQASGTDPVVREATVDSGSGTLIVPPRTVAVFVRT